MAVTDIHPAVGYVWVGPAEYTFLFKIFEASNISVYHTDVDGVVVKLGYLTYYTVIFDPDIDGGRVSITWDAKIGGSIDIRRELPLVQNTEWENNDPFSALQLENDLDKIVMLLQQLDYVAEAGAAASTWRGDWQTAYPYVVKDLIAAPNSSLYICIVGHTSGTFSTDLSTGYWQLVIDVAAVETARIAAEAAAVAAGLSEIDAEAAASAAAASEIAAGLSESLAAVSEAGAVASEINAANCAADAHEAALLCEAGNMVGVAPITVTPQAAPNAHLKDIAINITGVSADDVLAIESGAPVWKPSPSVRSVVGTTGEIDVDITDPANPVLSTPIGRDNQENIVYNSAFEVNQRGGAAKSGTGYGVDRWYNMSTDMTTTPGSASRISRLKILRTGSATEWYIRQALPIGVGNIFPLYSKYVLSFDFYTDRPLMAAAFRLYFLNDINLTTNLVSIMTGSTTAPTSSWMRASFDISINVTPHANNVLLALDIGGASGTSQAAGSFCYVRNVKLERGTIETQYVSPYVITEMNRCMKYYIRRIPFSAVQDYKSASRYFYQPITYPVRLRSTPSLSVESFTGGTFDGVTGGTQYGFWILKTVSNVSVGDPVNGFIIADSEFN